MPACQQRPPAEDFRLAPPLFRSAALLSLRLWLPSQGTAPKTLPLFPLGFVYILSAAT